MRQLKFASLAIGIYWFAIIDSTGQAVFMEYRTKGACEIVQKAYMRAGLHVTTCIIKD